MSGMREARAADLPRILAYLRPHVEECLYMYIDIAKYGLDNPAMRVWLEEGENGLRLVVMKYHTGISLYTA